MIVVIAIAMLIFTATVSILSGLQNAPSAFSADGGYVISETSAPTIFSSSLDNDMVAALESFPEITATSPEVYAFSSWNGISFVLRGVDLERLNRTGPRFEAFELAEPLSTSGVETALLGSRLAERFGVELPYTVPVVGSYSSKFEVLRIVGTYTTGTSLDDEMLSTLDVARFLSGTKDDTVSIIRVSTSDPSWLSNLLSPESARFTLYDLHASTALAAREQPVTFSVEVRNWGGKTGSATVTFSESTKTLKQQEVSLNSESSTLVQASVVFDTTGVHTVEVSVSGDFPVKLYANVTVVEPYLRVSAPSKILLGSTFNVTVTKHTGEPVSTFVSFLSTTVVSDSEGKAALVADQLGTYIVTANLSGYADGSAIVHIGDFSEYANTFNPAVVSFVVSPSLAQSSDDLSCVVVIDNNGTEAGHVELVLYEDSVSRLSANISLEGMSSYTWRFQIPAPDPGTHYLQVGNISQSVVVEPWYADNPELVQLVIRYGGSSSLSSSSGIPIYKAAKISEGNVAAALFALGAVSAVLAVLAISSVLSYEVMRSRRTLGILKTIGATRSEVWKLIFPQAFENGLAGAAIGTAIGIIIADQLSRSGFFLLFGHVLSIEFETGFLVLVLLGSVAICLASAFSAAAQAGRQVAVRSIRGLDDEWEVVEQIEGRLEDQ